MLCACTKQLSYIAGAHSTKTAVKQLNGVVYSLVTSALESLTFQHHINYSMAPKTKSILFRSICIDHNCAKCTGKVYVCVFYICDNCNV